MHLSDKEAHRGLKILEYIETEAITKSAGLIYIGIPRTTFYRWRKKYIEFGVEGLKPLSPVPKKIYNRAPEKTEKLISEMREKLIFGPKRIQWCLERYYNIKIFDSTVTRCLKRNGKGRLPYYTKKRSPGPTYKAYEKENPCQYIQMDVKFLIFKKEKKKIRRFQYTAIDDSTRMRVLKIYDGHTQSNPIQSNRLFHAYSKEIPI